VHSGAKLHFLFVFCTLSEVYQRFVQLCYAAAWWNYQYYHFIEILASIRLSVNEPWFMALCTFIANSF